LVSADAVTLDPTMGSCASIVAERHKRSAMPTVSVAAANVEANETLGGSRAERASMWLGRFDRIALHEDCASRAVNVRTIKA
jgi:hypothetical protein